MLQADGQTDRPICQPRGRIGRWQGCVLHSTCSPTQEARSLGLPVVSWHALQEQPAMRRAACLGACRGFASSCSCLPAAAQTQPCLPCPPCLPPALLLAGLWDQPGTGVHLFHIFSSLLSASSSDLSPVVSLLSPTTISVPSLCFFMHRSNYSFQFSYILPLFFPCPSLTLGHLLLCSICAMHK